MKHVGVELNLCPEKIPFDSDIRAHALKSNLGKFWAKVFMRKKMFYINI